jgi:hypothetical protein
MLALGLFEPWKHSKHLLPVHLPPGNGLGARPPAPATRKRPWCPPTCRECSRFAARIMAQRPTQEHVEGMAKAVWELLQVWLGP